MPTVPLVQPPITGPSAPANVRANPGMYDAVGAAGRQLGGAIEGVGDLAARVKQATDTAYLIGAQTKLEAAHQDFKAWTLQNPDTSTWKPEFDAHTQAAREDALSGAGSLSAMAKRHLTTAVNSWGVRAGSDLNLMATQQNLRNAQGVAEEGVNQAIAGNDAVGAAAIIDTAVKQGVLHPNVGAAMQKRVRVGIATNLANADAMADPFTAVDKLKEKDEAGTYTNYPGLPQPARDTMLFRANKLANETRAQTLRTWSQQIANAQNGTGIMPDMDGVKAEAERQGIAPKVIDKMFAPPKATDPHEFATAYTAVTNYDPAKDPTHEHLGDLVAQVEGFKGPAKQRLDALLAAKTKPDKQDPLQKQVTVAGEKAITDMFNLGGYGKFHVPAREDAQGNKIPATVNPVAKQNAEVVLAHNLDTFHDWVKTQTDAGKPPTHEQAQLFINSLNRKARANALWAPPINPQTGAVHK